MNIIKFNNSILKYDGKWLETNARPDYNPLNLPPNTFRVRTSDGTAPTGHYNTATLVPGTSDVYDVYKSGTNLSNMFAVVIESNLVEVLGANTTGVTNMRAMFNNCQSLTSVPLFDTSSVTNMRAMFSFCTSLTNIPLFDTSKVTDMESMIADCRSLTSVPLFDTSSVTNMRDMFEACTSLTSVPLFDTSNITDMNYMLWNCTNVQSGALALYQQASSQANPPSNHTETFKDCGSNTVTGAAELDQIPSDWK